MVLSESFHVVYVHTHHVAKPVRQEHCMCSGSYSLFCVALHQADFFQLVGHQTAYSHVYVIPFYTWFGYIEHIVVAGLNNAVYFTLALSELAVYGICAGVV